MKAFLAIVVFALIVAGIRKAVLRRGRNEGRNHAEGEIFALHENGRLGFSIGTETLGGLFEPLISVGTTLPASATMDFSTAADHQAAVEFRILQGFSPLSSKNVELVNYKFSGLPSAPRGVPQIRTTLVVREDGRITVDAEELYRGKRLKVVEVSSNQLTGDEVRALRLRSGKDADDDEREAANIRAKNEADVALYMGRKLLEGGFGAAPSSTETARVNALMDEVLAAQSCGSASKLSASASALRAAVTESSGFPAR